MNVWIKNKKMESKDKLKEIDIKNRACYYFDEIVKTKNYMKIFQFMTFHTKLQRFQIHYVLGSIK